MENARFIRIYLVKTGLRKILKINESNEKIQNRIGAQWRRHLRFAHLGVITALYEEIRPDVISGTSAACGCFVAANVARRNS